MDKKTLTEGNFDRRIRPDLRFSHHLNHEQLERAKRIVGEAIAHVEDKKHTTGLQARHFDTAMDYLDRKHKEWRELSDTQQNHIRESLQDHFGLNEEKEAA